MTVSPQRHQFKTLDAMRGIAAVLVVGFHATGLHLNRSLLVNGSVLCVDLFFCISGFVICYAYESRLMGSMTFSSFFRARCIRLYPLYLVGLMIGASYKLVGLLLTISGKQIIYQGSGNGLAFLFSLLCGLFMIPDPFPSRMSPLPFSINPPGWSLFYEIVINLLFALMLRKKLGGNLLLLLSMSLSFLFLTRLELAHPGSILEGGFVPNSYLTGLARVTWSFFAGVLLCRWFLARNMSMSPTWLSQVLSLLAIGGMLSVLASPLRDHVNTMAWNLGCIGVLIPLVVFIGTSSTLPKMLHPLANLLGEVSYPLYVIHYPLFYFVSYVLTKYRFARFSANPFAYPCILTVLLLVSTVLARRYDEPVRRWMTARDRRLV